MHLLLFEVTPFPDRRNEYLDIAARLKPELERVGGCLHIERFRHLVHAEKLLSFQIWQDEAAIVAWRSNSAHQEVQLYGREKVFEDYRLRVAEVLTGASDPSALDVAANEGRLVVVLQSGEPDLPAEHRDGLSVQSFASLYRPDQYLHLIEPAPAQLDQIRALRAGALEQCHPAVVTRDYGLFERQQAPQARPPVRRG